MSKKKSKRSRSVSSTESTQTFVSPEGKVSIPRRAVDDNQFNPDYTDIISDLKRIGTLAGVFFVLLIALSFIL